MIPIFTVPGELWDRVTRWSKEEYCINCFDSMAHKEGIVIVWTNKEVNMVRSVVSNLPIIEDGSLPDNTVILISNEGNFAKIENCRFGMDKKSSEMQVGN